MSTRDFEATVSVPALAAWECAIQAPLAACFQTSAPLCTGTRVTIGVRLYAKGNRFSASGVGTSGYGEGVQPPAQCLFAAIDHDVPRPNVESTFNQIRVELR